MAIIQACFPTIKSYTTVFSNHVTILDLPIITPDQEACFYELLHPKGFAMKPTGRIVEGDFVLVRAAQKLRAMGVQWIRLECSSLLLGGNWRSNTRYVKNWDSPWDIVWLSEDQVGYIMMVLCTVDNNWEEFCREVEKNCN